MAKKSKNTGASTAIMEKLDEILEMELSGVVRYLHYSLMVRGPNRIPIVNFFRTQANESFTHATVIGEKITSLGGHPSIKVKPVPESNKHDVLVILRESMEFEKEGLQMYKDLLPMCGDNVALEEMVREFIRTEQEHLEEVNKMLDTRK